MIHMNNATLIAEVEATLLTRFPDATLEIIDDSAAHHGHPGHGGAAHLRLKIASTVFDGLSLVQQHRLIYDALAAFMGARIHALQIIILKGKHI